MAEPSDGPQGDRRTAVTAGATRAQGVTVWRCQTPGELRTGRRASAAVSMAGRGIGQQMAAWIELEAIHLSGRAADSGRGRLWEDPDILGADDGRAGYVHLLMVDGAHAGIGLGDRMLCRVGS